MRKPLLTTAFLTAFGVTLAFAQGMVTGTVSSVDSPSRSVTITDESSGSSRTFTVNQQSDLAGIKSGDRITVTTDQNDSTTAIRIQRK